MFKISSKLSHMVFGLCAVFSLGKNVLADTTMDSKIDETTKVKINQLIEEAQKVFGIKDFKVTEPLIKIKSPLDKEEISLNFLQLLGLSGFKYNLMPAIQRETSANQMSIIRSIANIAKIASMCEINKDKISAEEIQNIRDLHLGLFDSLDAVAELIVFNSLGKKEGIIKEIKKLFDENPDISKTFSFIVAEGDKADVTKLYNNLKDKKPDLVRFKKVTKEILGKFDENKSKYSNKSLNEIEMQQILSKKGIAALKALKKGEMSDIIEINDRSSCIVYLVNSDKKEIDVDKFIPQFLNNKKSELIMATAPNKAVAVTPYFEKIFGGKDLDALNENVMKKFTDLIINKDKKSDETKGQDKKSDETILIKKSDETKGQDKKSDETVLIKKSDQPITNQKFSIDEKSNESDNISNASTSDE